MADDLEDTPPAPPAAPSPPLQDFAAAFTHPVAQEWAADSATILNDYFQRRNIADASAQAGQTFVNNLDQFKTGLTNFVQSDPHAVHAALDLVPPTVKALVSTLPGGIENPDDHYETVTGHIQHEIAAAAITTAAETHEGLARSLLGNDRISNVLGESAGPLDTYIGMQAQARERDAAAQRGQQEVQLQKVADTTSRDYIGDLVGPDGGVRSPAGWNQAILSDPRIPPQNKIDLMGIHDRLGQGGDAPTDPVAAADLIHRLATGAAGQHDLYPAIGSHLSLADGGFMAASLHNPTYLNQLDQTIQAAQRQFAPHSDVAETQAFGRFVDWLLPRARAGANLDPNHPEWVGANGMPDFRVQGDDLQAARMQDVAYRQSIIERRSLSEIFSNPEYRKPTRERMQAAPLAPGVRGPAPRLEPGPGDFVERIPSGWQMNQRGQLEPAGTAEGHNPNEAPFTGVRPLSNDQAINPAGTDRDATGKLLREVSTDQGIKALGTADLAHSTTAPRPVPRQVVQTEAEKAAILGRNANVRFAPKVRTPRKGGTVRG